MKPLRTGPNLLSVLARKTPYNINSIAYNTTILRLAKRWQVYLPIFPFKLFFIDVPILCSKPVSAMEMSGGLFADPVRLLRVSFYADVRVEGFAF